VINSEQATKDNNSQLNGDAFAFALNEHKIIMVRPIDLALDRGVGGISYKSLCKR
jgi:hypothetical protein